MAEQPKLSGITVAAIALVVIGALNWGLIGLFNYNVVTAIFGDATTLSRIVYMVVALSGIYLAVDTVRLREVSRHRPIATIP